MVYSYFSEGETMNRVCQYCGGKQPTPEQIEALDDYAKANGRYWKMALRHSWETGSYDRWDNVATLQQIRNTFGPSWLQSYRVTGSRPAQ